MMVCDQTYQPVCVVGEGSLSEQSQARCEVKQIHTLKTPEIQSNMSSSIASLGRHYIYYFKRKRQLLQCWMAAGSV